MKLEVFKRHTYIYKCTLKVVDTAQATQMKRTYTKFIIQDDSTLHKSKRTIPREILTD